MRLNCKQLFLLLVILATASCGGGGGGGSDPYYPGEVSLQATPTSVDTGDRVAVKVQVVNPNTRGVVVKVRFPAELSYVTRTSFLKVDGVAARREPDKKGTSSADSKYYLVYIMPQSELGNDQFGEITLALRADTKSDSAKIEVDIDIVDPSKSSQFELSAPEFTAQDDTDIHIAG